MQYLLVLTLLGDISRSCGSSGEQDSQGFSTHGIYILVKTTDDK